MILEQNLFNFNNSNADASYSGSDTLLQQQNSEGGDFPVAAQKLSPQLPTISSDYNHDSLEARAKVISGSYKTGLDNQNFFLTGIEEDHNIHAHGMYAPGTVITDEFVNSGYQWSQPGGDGTPVTITYSYSNLLDGTIGIASSQITSAIEEALGLWAKYAPLNFVEVTDSGPTPSDSYYSASGKPDIRFGYHNIDGRGNILAHAYYPFSTTNGIAGDVHFDIGDNWTIGSAGSAFDLLEVAVHEIGHALGLGHEPMSGNNAIMNPYYSDWYSGLGNSFLFPDDINGIRDIYGSGTGSVTPLPTEKFTIQRWATRQGGFWNDQQWLVGDFNGDGRDDMAKSFNDSGLASLDVHLSNGSGFTIQRWATRQGGFWNDQQWLVGDFNGDGRDDMAKSFNDSGLASLDVHLSNGSGFTIQRWATRQGGFWNDQQWLVGDFNGDGRDDMAKSFNDASLASLDVHLSIRS